MKTIAFAIRSVAPPQSPLGKGGGLGARLGKGEGLCARRRIIPLLTKEGLGEVVDGVLGIGEEY